MGEGALEGIQGEKVGLFVSQFTAFGSVIVLVVTADEAAAVPEKNKRQGNERREKKKGKLKNGRRKMTLCSGFDLKAC